MVIQESLRGIMSRAECVTAAGHGQHEGQGIRTVSTPFSNRAVMPVTSAVSGSCRQHRGVSQVCLLLLHVCGAASPSRLIQPDECKQNGATPRRNKMTA